MGEIAREFFRSAERDTRTAMRFDEEIDRSVVSPIQDIAVEVGASLDGLPTAAQIRESMGGVLRGIMYGIIMNRRGIREGAEDLSCEVNKMAADALEEI